MLIKPGLAEDEKRFLFHKWANLNLDELEKRLKDMDLCQEDLFKKLEKNLKNKIWRRRRKENSQPI